QEKLVAPEDEPGSDPAGQTRMTSALDDMKRGAEQDIAAEGEDDRRRVDGPQSAEIEPSLAQIENRKGKFKRDIHADQQADDRPEHGRDHADAHDSVVVAAVRLVGI